MRLKKKMERKKSRLLRIENTSWRANGKRRYVSLYVVARLFSCKITIPL